jgi:uncharacterized protein (DUF58 family)
MILPLPTRRGIIVILTAIGGTGAAMVNPGPVSAMIAAILLALVTGSFITALLSLHGISLHREPHRDGQRGNGVMLPLQIHNRSRYYRQTIVIEEYCEFIMGAVICTQVDPMAPGEIRDMQRTVTPLKRGHFEFNKIYVNGGDPAGLFRRRRVFKIPGQITIYPASIPVSTLPLHRRGRFLPDANGRPLGISGQGQEFFGIREYRSQDEFRFIHWKASAAKGTLMVKEFEVDSVENITILLDTEGGMIGEDQFESNFEFIINTTASITDCLAEMYCRMQFFAGGENDSLIRIEGGASGIRNQVINALAMAQPGTMSASELLNRVADNIYPDSVFYCLTMSSPEEFQDRFEVLSERGVDIRWICAPKKYFPYVPDELRDRPISSRPPESFEEQEFHGVQPIVATRDVNIGVMLRHD